MNGQSVSTAGLTVLVDPHRASLDVVFIHGFTGHPKDTWTHGSKGTRDQNESCERGGSFERPSKVPKLNPISEPLHDEVDQNSATYWPRDLVPATLSDARILTFGFEKHVRHVLNGNVNDKTVYDIAWDLLLALDVERRKEPLRRILFVAHSLGGIVVKEMLRRADSCQQSHTHLRNVFKATIGMIFFGTPHSHSGPNPRGFFQRITEGIIRLARVSTNERALNTLLPSSQRLKEFKEGFGLMAHQQNWMIHSFQEGAGTGNLNENKVVEDDLSHLDLPSIETKQHIARNHLEMCCFSGPDDLEYKKVAAALTGIASTVSVRPTQVEELSDQEGQRRRSQDGEEHDLQIINDIDDEQEIGDSSASTQTRANLQEMAFSVFVSASLVVQMLNKEHDAGSATRHLQQRLKSGYTSAFLDCLGTDRPDTNKTFLCILWILHSRQPLIPEQLYHAIYSGADPENLTKWDSRAIPMKLVRKVMRRSSKGLAEITTSGKPVVHFINESVKCFVQKNGLKDVSSQLRSNSEAEAHELLKQCCLNYMSINTFDLYIRHSRTTKSTQEASRYRLKMCREFPFLQYAVQNILHHAEAAEISGVHQKDFVQNFPLTRWLKLQKIIEPIKIRKYTAKASLLYILAENNLSALMRIHPLTVSCFDVQDERYGPPLFAAIATKSHEAVQTFLDDQAECQPPESPLRDLCKQYFAEGNKRIELGRDFKFSRRRNMLSYVAEKGDEIICALMLASGNYDADMRDNDERRTALSWAAENGHNAIIKQLLTTGKADAHSKDKHDQTPLSWAASTGQNGTIELLLSQGKVDTGAKDRFGQTPLSWAAYHGHMTTVELLLTRGYSGVVDAKDNKGRTALSYAAIHGQKAVVESLLATGIYDVSRDNEGKTALNWALEKGYCAIAAILLGTGNF